MQNYVDLIAGNPVLAGNPGVAITLMFLGLGRLLPIIALSPFFGARVLPNPVKVAFGIMLFILFLPVIVENVTTPIVFSPWIIGLLFKEMFIGFSMGFIMSAPFIIVQNVGMLIDHQRGGASLLVNDPTIQNQSSPLGTIFNMILIYVFYVIDGPFYFMNAMVEAYQLIPPDKLLSANFFTEASPFWKTQMTIFNTIMVISAQLGAPALIAILMTDMFLGIANRLAPQVQITFLGLPLKSLLALLVICLGFKLYTEQTIVVCFKLLNILRENIVNFTIR